MESVKHQYQVELDGTQQQIADLQLSYERKLQHKEEYHSTQTTMLKQQLAHYQSTVQEQTQLLEQCAGNQTKNAELQGEVMKLKKKTEEIEALGEQVKGLTDERSQLTGENKKVKEQLESLKKAKNQLNSDFEKITKKYKELEKEGNEKSHSLNKTVKKLNQEILNLQVTIKQFEGKMSSLESENKKL